MMAKSHGFSPAIGQRSKSSISRLRKVHALGDCLLEMRKEGRKEVVPMGVDI